MNTIATFRECTLSDNDLLEKVDELTDTIFKTQSVPTRHIPARPNEDYDLLVGELILRFKDRLKIEEYQNLQVITIAGTGYKNKHVPILGSGKIEYIDLEPTNNMCSCDGCGKQYEEPNPSYVFGEFNVCPECKKRTDLQWQ